MKRIITLFLAILMAFTLIACTPKEVEVSIIIPEDIVGLIASTDEESFVEELTATPGIISVVQNEDGSIAITMTKTAQDRILQEIITTTDETIAELVADENYSFTAITYNENMSEFNLIADGDLFNATDAALFFDFAIIGYRYQCFSGETEISATIYFIDDETGEDLLFPIVLS